ncbi:RHS repeat domain-containing protein, partial [Paenibacillus sonchi]
MKFTFNRCIFIFGIALFVFLDVTSNSALAMKSYFYDTNGRLVQESALTGETVRYSYDQNGNLKSKSSGESFFQYLSAFSSEQGQSNWYYQI